MQAAPVPRHTTAWGQGQCPGAGPQGAGRCRAGCLVGPWVLVGWVEGEPGSVLRGGEEWVSGKTWGASLQGLRTFTSLSFRGARQRGLGQEEDGHLLPTRLLGGAGPGPKPREREDLEGQWGGGQLGSGPQRGGQLVESRAWGPQQVSVSTRRLSSLFCSFWFSMRVYADLLKRIFVLFSE